MLEVVENDQHLPRGQVVGNDIDQRLAPLLLDVKLLRDQRDRTLGSVGWSERHESDAIGKFVSHRAGDAQGQTCLPNSARAGECEQPEFAPSQQATCFSLFSLASDEWCRLCWEAPWERA